MRVMPFGDDNNSLGSPVLLASAIVFGLEQNAEAAGTVGAVERGAEGVGKFVLHASAVGFGSVAEEPGEAGVGRRDLR